MRRVLRRLALPALLALAALAGPGRGVAEDLDPNALFDSAKSAYGAKKYGKALADLKLLVGEVARLRAEALKPLLPGAPVGWTAEGAEASADFAALGFLSQGFSLSRRYTKGEASVTLELWVDSPMVAMFAATLPMAQAMGQTVVRFKNRQAVLDLDKESKSGSVTVALAANTAMLKLSGQGVTKEDLVGFGNAIDFDALEKSLVE